MKYLILSTFELDGHSSADVCICEGATNRSKYLQSLLYNEDAKTLYPTRHHTKEDDGTEYMYGDWECGQWSIMIKPFKTYTEIKNKEFFTRTG